MKDIVLQSHDLSNLSLGACTVSYESRQAKLSKGHPNRLGTVQWDYHNMLKDAMALPKLLSAVVGHIKYLMDPR